MVVRHARLRKANLTTTRTIIRTTTIIPIRMIIPTLIRTRIHHTGIRTASHQKAHQ